MKEFLLLINLIVIYQINTSSVSLNDSNNIYNATRTVKKELQNLNVTVVTEVPSNITSNVTLIVPKEKIPDLIINGSDTNLHINTQHFKSMTEDPDALKFGIYLFAGLGFMAIIFITYRSFRLRTSRAERRYGPLGHHSNYELTPLPLNDDSENDDQTLFDLNQTKNLVN